MCKRVRGGAGAGRGAGKRGAQGQERGGDEQGIGEANGQRQGERGEGRYLPCPRERGEHDALVALGATKRQLRQVLCGTERNINVSNPANLHTCMCLNLLKLSSVPQDSPAHPTALPRLNPAGQAAHPH